MKQKKLLLPSLLLAVALIASVILGVVEGIAHKPTVTAQSFPFSITYQYQGTTYTIEDVYHCSYKLTGGDYDPKGRYYTGHMEGREDEDTSYLIAQDGGGELRLFTNFYPDYLLGDPMYDDYYDGESLYEPLIIYYDQMGDQYYDEATYAAKEIQLISWEYPQPIENELVFSHIGRLSSSVVLPLVGLGLITLLLTLLLVRKEKELVYGPMDKLSTVLNFAVVLFVLPFMAVVAGLSDINGATGTLGHTLIYYVPFFTVLSVAASLSLRRKGMSKAGLFVLFLSPILLVLSFPLAGL